MIRKKYDDLGKPSYEEWVVGFHFVTLGLFLNYSLKNWDSRTAQMLNQTK